MGIDARWGAIALSRGCAVSLMAHVSAAAILLKTPSRLLRACFQGYSTPYLEVDCVSCAVLRGRLSRLLRRFTAMASFSTQSSESSHSNTHGAPAADRYVAEFQAWGTYEGGEPHAAIDRCRPIALGLTN